MEKLKLKVSEEKYRQTLDKLGAELDKMQGHQKDLQKVKENMQNGVIGNVGNDAVRNLDTHLHNVQTVITKTIAARTQIENYLNSMTQTQSTITDDLKALEDEANAIFG